MIGPRQRSTGRLAWTIVLGMILGALLSKLTTVYLPDSAARKFLTTAISGSIGPLGIDLIAFGFVVGPFSISLNVLSLMGVAMVALVARSWL
jgi:hypothetical protein